MADDLNLSLDSGREIVRRPFFGEFLHAPESAVRIPNMTVGIGVICEDGNAAVIAADRLATTLEGVYEADYKKIRVISPRIVVACAGANHEMNHVLATVHDDPNSSLMEFSERLRKSREAMRSCKIDDLIFTRLGIKLSEFSQVISRSESQTYMELVREVKGFQLGMNLLVVGLDDSGAHLWYVDSLPIPASFDDEGFIAIGSGGNHSATVLASRKYRKSFSLPQAVFSVYAAKRAAEMNAHVGRKTDMVILETGKEPRFLEKPAMLELNTIFKAKAKANRLSKSERNRLSGCL